MASAAESEPERHGLLRSTSVVSGMTLLSRVSGLARDVGFSHWFGAGIVTDAFFVAFKIPNLFRRFFAEGAFSQAFVPLIAEYRATRSPQEARDLIAGVAGTLSATLFVITAVGVVAAPLLMLVFGAGFVGDADGRYELASAMLRWTFPYLLFISLTALAGGVLNTYRRFAVPAFTPVLLNLVLLSFAYWIAPRMREPGMALAIGVFTAGLVQLAFQLPFLLKQGLLPMPRWGWAEEGVRRIVKLMLPIMFGSSVAQINILFDTLIASFLVTGSISWLYYSDRLVEFPLGVFGIALATVILPNLSEHHARASDGEFSATLDWALRWVLMIVLPAALGLVLLAEPLLTTIFHGGEFTADDVRMSGASLRAFAPGLIGFVLVKVLSPGYFARQDSRTPVRIGIKALLVGMGLNLIFVLVLLQTGWAPAHAGLAAATSLSALLNASLLLAGLTRTGVYQPGHGWQRLALQVVVACAAMSSFVSWARVQFGDWLLLTLWEQVGALTVCVGGAVAVYGLACLVCGLRPAQLRAPRAA